MFRDLVAQAVRPYYPLSNEQLDALEAHYSLLRQWNQKLNLTRLESEEEAATLHYGESIFLATKLPPGSLRIADLGSGAGFPGFPIAIVRPECSVTLVESHQRKTVFLREAARNHSSVRVLNTRIEDVGESFDWVVCRAVNWESIEKSALSLAPRAAFLGSEGEIRLPWGKNRFIHIVSRET